MLKSLFLVIILIFATSLVSAKNYWNLEDAPSYKMIELKSALKNQKMKINDQQSGKEIIIAIIDTGIDSSHPLFKNSFSKKFKQGGVDFSGSKSIKDSHGHGTHIAGIIKTIAPQAKLLPLKYYNPKASGLANLRSTIKALRYAVEIGVDIINYSGGGPEASEEEKLLIKKAQEKGILIVAAAGNESSNIDDKKKTYQQYFPANYDFNNIIAVNAINNKRKFVDYSNYGQESVDIAAPGFKVKSAFFNNRLALMTGTSQATAFVSGIAALVKARHPEFNYAQIKETILKSAKKIESLKNKNASQGCVDALAALKQSDIIAKNLKKIARNVAKK